MIGRYADGSCVGWARLNGSGLFGTTSPVMEAGVRLGTAATWCHLSRPGGGSPVESRTMARDDIGWQFVLSVALPGVANKRQWIDTTLWYLVRGWHSVPRTLCSDNCGVRRGSHTARTSNNWRRRYAAPIVGVKFQMKSPGAIVVNQSRPYTPVDNHITERRQRKEEAWSSSRARRREGN